MDESEEAAVLRRFRAGAPDAHRLLFERYTEEVRGRIRGRLPPALYRRVGVSDILQETQFAAFTSRGEFIGETVAGFREWLLGIAEHKTADAVRRHDDADCRSVRREEPPPDTGAGALLAAPDPSPSEVAVAGELAVLAMRARLRLPADHREILVLTREEGLTLAEAAARMGRTREAAKKLYGRAIVRFKREFDRLKGNDRDGE